MHCATRFSFHSLPFLTRRIRPENAGVPEGQRDSVRLVSKLARIVTDMNFDLFQRDRLPEFTSIREVHRDQVASCGGLVRCESRDPPVAFLLLRPQLDSVELDCDLFGGGIGGELQPEFELINLVRSGPNVVGQ